MTDESAKCPKCGAELSHGGGEPEGNNRPYIYCSSDSCDYSQYLDDLVAYYMDDQSFKNRIKEVLTEELKEPESAWWLSFADNVFKGAVIMRAHGITDALMKCNLLGINPGGEVCCTQIPEDKIQELQEDDWNRLISKEEIERRWGIMTLDEFHEQQEEAS